MHIATKRLSIKHPFRDTIDQICWRIKGYGDKKENLHD